MTLLNLILLSLAAGALGPAELDGAVQDAPGPCGIAAEPDPEEGLWLQAWAAPDLAGEYRFLVILDGPGGEADIEQDGATGDAGPLGEIWIQPGAAWTASLEIVADDGGLICAADSASL